MKISKSSLIQETLEKLFIRFNEPVIPRSSIEKWLGRFDDDVKPAAIKLLDQIEFHSQPRLTRETRQLHERVKKRLAAGGFDSESLSDVDFSREFTCKSGDVVSYLYRKTNLIPTIYTKVHWKNSGCLLKEILRRSSQQGSGTFPMRISARISISLEGF